MGAFFAAAITWKYMRFWLPVVIVAAILGGVYLWAVHNTIVKNKLKEQKILIERIEKGTEAIYEGSKHRTQIRESIQSRPIDSKRDTCLLSAQRTKDCDEYL